MLKNVAALTSTAALLANLLGCASAPAPASETADSITVKDPENGTMYYDAKIGMMDVD